MHLKRKGKCALSSRDLQQVSGHSYAHTTMHRNSINFLYNPGHVTLLCLEVVPVLYARVGGNVQSSETNYGLGYANNTKIV